MFPENFMKIRWDLYPLGNCHGTQYDITSTSSTKPKLHSSQLFASIDDESLRVTTRDQFVEDDPVLGEGPKQGVDL